MRRKPPHQDQKTKRSSDWPMRSLETRRPPCLLCLPPRLSHRSKPRNRRRHRRRTHPLSQYLPGQDRTWQLGPHRFRPHDQFPVLDRQPRGNIGRIGHHSQQEQGRPVRSVDNHRLLLLTPRFSLRDKQQFSQQHLLQHLLQLLLCIIFLLLQMLTETLTWTHPSPKGRVLLRQRLIHLPLQAGVQGKLYLTHGWFI